MNDDIKPMYHARASRGSPRPSTPPPVSSSAPNPLGVALGLLGAGGWSLLFPCVLLPHLVLWLSVVLTVIGYLAIFLALLLVGVSLSQVINRQRGYHE